MRYSSLAAERMKENERRNGQEVLRKPGAPHLPGTGVSMHWELWGGWFLSSKVVKSRGGIQGRAREENMLLTCGTLSAKVRRTPVRKEHCSAKDATVSVRGGPNGQMAP